MTIDAWQSPSAHMADIRSPRLLYIKGLLFILLGVLSAGFLVWESASWRTALLLGICIWSSCRAYYFAFYVVEHYVDGEFRYRGLVHFLRYALRRRLK